MFQAISKSNAVILIAAALWAAAPGASQTVTLVGVPGAGSAIPTVINDAGTAAGHCSGGPCGAFTGFVRKRDGGITTFQVASGASAIPSGITSRGDVLGTCASVGPPGGTPCGRGIGYVRDFKGNITTFAVPGSFGTTASSINEEGAITGHYEYGDPSVPSEGSFVRDRDGALATFIVPGSTSTRALSINAAGEITGTCNRGPCGSLSGFVRDRHGNLTVLTLPTATVQPKGISASGAIAGLCFGPDCGGGSTKGFVRDRAGNFTIFAPPQASDIYSAIIAASGRIAGYYSTTDFKVLAFVRDPAGNFTVPDIGGARLVLVYGVSSSGSVVGLCSSGQCGSGSGFIWTR